MKRKTKSRRGPTPRAVMREWPSQRALAADLDVKQQTISQWFVRKLKQVPRQHWLTIAKHRPEKFGYLVDL